MIKPSFTEKIRISFKGQRNYVYASDVFVEVIKAITTHFPNKKITNIDFSTHKMAQNNLELNVYEENVRDRDNAQSVFLFTIDNRDYCGILVETNEIIINRQDYPEEKLYNLFSYNKEHKSIFSNSIPGFSTMDIFTSMNKFMLTDLFPEITNGWLSVRTKLNSALPNTYNSLEVRFQKNFSNRYYQSVLFLDNELVGTLFFSIK